MSLRDQYQEQLRLAKAALDAGNLDEARAQKSAANQTLQLMREQAEIDEMTKSIPPPARPPVPGAPDGVKVEDSFVSNTATKSAPVEPDPIGTSRRAAYLTRFGSTDDVVKSILTDLHGSDYEAKYWAQKGVFRRYLRYGDADMTTEDRRIMREPILNGPTVKSFLENGWDDINAVKTTMVEAADSLIGNFVPVDFQMNIIERMVGKTIFRGRATTSTTNRDRVERPKITGGDSQYSDGMRGKWVDETPTAGTAATNFTTGLEAIDIHTYMAEVFLSRNSVEDSAFNVEGYLSRKFAEMSAMDEDISFLIGNGVGKPRGVLPGSANANAITEKASLDSSKVTWNGLIGMTYGVDAQYRQAGAVWIANKSTYETIAKLYDSNFGYYWKAYQTNGGESGTVGPPPLLGYKTLEQESMPDIASNAYPVLFGNLNAYEIVDRLGMTVERYIDSTTARQNMVCFVLRRRVGGRLLEPWQMVVMKVASSV